MITPAQIKGVGDIAARHGIDHIHLTTRQTLELTHVDPTKLEPLLADLAANGTPLGAEREEVVNVTACLGTRNCKFGIIDSVGLAAEIDKKFFGKESARKGADRDLLLPERMRERAAQRDRDHRYPEADP